MAQVENWKIEWVMDSTGCSASRAIKYLEAEEWNVHEAVVSLRGDELDQRVSEPGQNDGEVKLPEDSTLPPWVRCSERMPERWESVLLAVGGSVPITAFVWTGERWNVGLSDMPYPYNPEFWMPLPKAPRSRDQ